MSDTFDTFQDLGSNFILKKFLFLVIAKQITIHFFIFIFFI